MILVGPIWPVGLEFDMLITNSLHLWWKYRFQLRWLNDKSKYVKNSGVLFINTSSHSYIRMCHNMSSSSSKLIIFPLVTAAINNPFNSSVIRVKLSHYLIVLNWFQMILNHCLQNNSLSAHGCTIHSYCIYCTCQYINTPKEPFLLRLLFICLRNYIINGKCVNLQRGL